MQAKTSNTSINPLKNGRGGQLNPHFEHLSRPNGQAKVAEIFAKLSLNSIQFNFNPIEAELVLFSI